MKYSTKPGSIRKRKWYQANPAKARKLMYAWRKKNRKRWLVLQRRGAHKHYDKLKTAAYNVLGNKCTKCPETDFRVLQIDHRDGKGSRHRRKCNGYDKLYRDVVKHPERFQILCANCNWRKRWDQIEHKRRTTEETY